MRERTTRRKFERGSRDLPENCDEFWMNDDGCMRNSISQAYT